MISALLHLLAASGCLYAAIRGHDWKWLFCAGMSFGFSFDSWFGRELSNMLEHSMGRERSLLERFDRVHMAVMRYESRHDMDPERLKLWRGIKDALLCPPPEGA